MSGGFQPTRGDLARDNVTLAVGSAYGLLGSETRAQLTAFLAGPRNPVAAYEVAQTVVMTTSDADLAFVLARLLMHADDQVMGVAIVKPAAAEDHPQRRSTDTVGG